jgi:hypothetical protein
MLHRNSLVLILFALYGCGTVANQAQSSAKEVSLKSAFQKDFLIGTALNAAQFQEKDPSVFFYFYPSSPFIF